MTSAIHLAVAKDYYNSPMTLEEIERKHGVSEGHITQVAKRIDFRRFQKEKEYCIIKVEREQMEAVKMILEGNNIHFDVPEKFEMTEFIESKMNQE